MTEIQANSIGTPNRVNSTRDFRVSFSSGTWWLSRRNASGRRGYFVAWPVAVRGSESVWWSGSAARPASPDCRRTRDRRSCHNQRQSIAGSDGGHIRSALQLLDGVRARLGAVDGRRTVGGSVGGGYAQCIFGGNQGVGVKAPVERSDKQKYTIGNNRVNSSTPLPRRDRFRDTCFIPPFPGMFSPLAGKVTAPSLRGLRAPARSPSPERRTGALRR